MLTNSHPVLTFVAASISVLAITDGLRAQNATTTAHVRLWKTELHDLNSVRVSLKPAGGRTSAARDLGVGGPGYLFDNYVDAPVGRGTLEVYVAADKHPLMTMPVNFSPGSFSTVLLREAEKPNVQPQLEVIEDPAVAPNPTSAQITVRNFVENLKEVRVTVGNNTDVQFPAGEGSVKVHDLKPAVYPVYTVGIGPDGKPFSWSTETDLKQHCHQTVLIYPDPYGRIRPRLCVDGEVPATQPEDRERRH